MPNFTTGSTLLPDIGKLDYNGCTFSPLFESNISGSAVKDEANRTVRYTEIVLTVDGYVTLGDRLANDISQTMDTLHRLLTAQGGSLVYEGRGFDLVINKGGGGVGAGAIFARPGGVDRGNEVAWGPVPDLIEFQPLGGGLSAKVKWKVTVRVSAMKAGKGFSGISSTSPLLQFNFDTSVTYNEDGFSTLSVRGILEIPMTRSTQATRSVPTTADDYRQVIQRQILRGIDLSRFSIKRREFNTSRDKRTLTWDFLVEEKPYMDLPPNCSIARGSYDVRPARAGQGLCLWLCTLRATYTLRADVPRRQAYLLFIAMVRLRMAESEKGNIPKIKDGGQGGGLKFDLPLPLPGITGIGTLLEINKLGSRFFSPKPAKREVEDIRKAILIDFTMNEGIHHDSKTATFSATWRICTTFSHILIASGLWTKLNETDATGRNLWAVSMSDVSGTTSWLTNRLDPSLDIIIDFGS